jgi:hypothetical protein
VEIAAAACVRSSALDSGSAVFRRVAVRGPNKHDGVRQLHTLSAHAPALLVFAMFLIHRRDVIEPVEIG